MAEQSTHINYSFEDIQRYLNGSMSAAEMHDIEKASLQDAFLADAIEGYTDANALTAQKHLNEINASLFSEKKKSRIVAFNKKTQWLSVAAVIIVIAGVGLISFFVLNKSNNKNDIAQVRKEQARKEIVTDTLKAQPKDSNIQQDFALQKSIPQNDVTENKQEEKQTLTASSAKKKKNYALPENETYIESKADLTAMAAPVPSQQVQQNETYSKVLDKASPDSGKQSIENILQGKVSGISITPNTFSGKVVDENNNPVAGALIESDDKKSIALTNLNGNFSLQKNDTLLNVTASTIGYKNNNTSLRARSANRIVLKADETALNDVVVTGYGAQKNKSATQPPTPVGGWENFNNYVVSQLNKDTTAEYYMTEKDLVELEFLIDKSGNPYDIKITKSLDDKRNSKAIDILKSGPKWTHTSKNKKARVAISF